MGQPVTERERIVSVMANAIGYVMIDPEGEGTMTLEERDRCLRAADRALRQGIESKLDDLDTEIKICTCSNNGYTTVHDEGCSLAAD